jgi:hypothetical protein
VIKRETGDQEGRFVGDCRISGRRHVIKRASVIKRKGIGCRRLKPQDSNLEIEKVDLPKNSRRADKSIDCS